jgi:hypothetical protein
VYCLSETWPTLRLRGAPGLGARRGVDGCRAGRNDPIGRGPLRHRAAGGWRTAGRGRRIPARRSGAADPGPAIGLQLDRPAAGSGSACSWIRAAIGLQLDPGPAITAAQKKTAGAWPAVRGSRIAAGGSGVDRVDQLLEVLERGGRLLQPPGRQHQQRELAGGSGRDRATAGRVLHRRRLRSSRGSLRFIPQLAL